MQRTIGPYEACGECGGALISAGDELVCKSCGLVYDQRYRMSYLTPELAKDQIPIYNESSSLGERPHLVDGLGSFIGYYRSYYFHDVNGDPLSPSSQEFFSHLKRVHDKRERVYKRGTDYRTLCALNRVADALNLPKVIRDRAAYLYRRARRDPLEKGVTTILVAAYCLLQATRELRSPNLMTIQEIANAFREIGHRVSAPAMTRAGFYCRKVLGTTPRIGRAEDFVDKVLQKIISSRNIKTKLGEMGINPFTFKEKLRDLSLSLLKGIDNVRRGGRNPYVLAVATVYAAQRALLSKKGRTLLSQRKLSKVTGVAEYTIREVWRALLSTLLSRTG